jgi:hypothetical protein
LRRLHRWAGGIAAIFILLLSVTGILINHAAEMGLDRRQAEAGWVRFLYGLPEQATVLGTRLIQGRAVWSGDSLHLGNASHPLEGYRGAVSVDGIVMAAGYRTALLLTLDGELVTRFSAAELPGEITRIGQSDSGRVVVETSRGRYAADQALLNWESSENVDVAWSVVETLHDADAQRVAGTAPAPSWEQVLLDAHSGRLFGIGGVLFMDAVAAAILFLMGSGLWTWWQNQRNRQGR